MPGETPEKTIDQSKTIDTPEISSNNEQRELLNLSTNIEANALKKQLEMLNNIKILLEGYKSLKKWIRTSEWNIQTQKQLTHRLNENIENLNNMWKDLWGNKESLKDPEERVTELKKNTHIYTDLSTYEWRIWQLQDWFDNYEQVRQIIVLWGRTSDFPAIIDSIQDAKKSRHYEKQDNKYQKRMNEILHNSAITSLRNNDMERYEEYLEAVVNWQIEPSSHPFYKAHCQSFNMIKSANPSLYQILAPSWWKRVSHETQHVVRIVEWVPATVAIKTSNQPESFSSKLWKWFWEVLWNLFPSIENNPKQKKAWEQFGAVAALGGSIFMWFKALQNLFSKKDTNPDKRKKTAWWTAGLIALINGDKIIKWWTNWFKDAFNIHPAEKIKASTEIFQRYWFSNPEAQRMAVMHVEAPIATLSALHFIPIYELNNQRIIEYQNNQFKFNYDNYKQYIDTYDAWTDEQRKAVLEAWKNLKDNDSLNDWLSALGINSDTELNKIANWDKEKTLADEPSIYERYLECTKGIESGVNKELYERWLKAKDLESAQKIIKEYNESNWKDIDKLIKKWKEEWLLEVATDCPMVRLLSDLWIKIEDPDEIKNTETRLNNIKDGMKDYAPWTEWYKPYSIEWNKLIFDTSDTESAQKIHIPDDRPDRFPDQHRTLDDFPTISKSENRNKFLEFMNDPQNHMRWKEISSRDN